MARKGSLKRKSSTSEIDASKKKPVKSFGADRERTLEQPVTGDSGSQNGSAGKLSEEEDFESNYEYFREEESDYGNDNEERKAGKKMGPDGISNKLLIWNR